MPRTLVTKRITVPGNLQAACDQFNRGQFFECHETLEEIWQQEHGPVRDLFKGLIQLAAAFVHITRNHYRGPDRLLGTAAGYLRPYTDTGAMGFDAAALVAAIEAAHARLRAAGPANPASLYPGAEPVLTFDAASLPAEARRWRAWGFNDEGLATVNEITIIE
ncbi:MAG: DUF309 domain-containing protein [Dehalococcoidia bacterium]|nr:DUF309 domain-containing protein [Dehalococcoidia bacterium]